MSRLTALHLWAAVLLFAAPLALAGNVAVGSCRPKLPSYPSISAAVGGVPAGTTIEVCPNTYFEQVFINQPLTLEGVASGNSTDVVIEPPGSLTTVTGFFSTTIAPIVAISAGPVNISNITLDGTGNNVSCSSFGATWLVGLYYGDGSSGTLNEATARNLITSGCYTGTGVWAESTSGQSVTIENSSFHDIEDSSVINLGNLIATVKGNYMSAGGYDVEWGSPGTLTDNDLEGPYVGIVYSTAGTFSGNTIANAYFSGIWSVYSRVSGAVFTSNKISHLPGGAGINVGGFGGPPDTFKSNTITDTFVGILFNCNTPIVYSNTINDAIYGFEQVPAGFGGSNKFNNVGTIRTDGCASPTKKSPEAPGRPGVPLPAPSH